MKVTIFRISLMFSYFRFHSTNIVHRLVSIISFYLISFSLSLPVKKNCWLSSNDYEPGCLQIDVPSLFVAAILSHGCTAIKKINDRTLERSELPKFHFGSRWCYTMQELRASNFYNMLCKEKFSINPSWFFLIIFYYIQFCMICFKRNG